MSWKRKTQNEFIMQAASVHNNYYDYSKVRFITMNDKVEITCPEHGVFWQNANMHVRGSKCKKCAMAIRSANRTKTTAQFVEEANIKHSNKYTYEKTIYTKSSDKITVTCKIHGDFSQSANSHVRGGGCPECAHIVPTNGWSYSEWEAYGKKSKNFNGFKLYILQCTDGEESFIKVGKTFVPIASRFDYKDLMPYQYIVKYVIEADARSISEIEMRIHIGDFLKYTPKMQFKGATECYYLEEYSNIVAAIEKDINDTFNKNITKNNS